MSAQTLSDLHRGDRDARHRDGLNLLRQTIEALYPAEFADPQFNSAARQTDVRQGRRMGVDVGGKVAVMTLAWLWPWAAVALLVAAVALVVVIVAVSVRRHRHDEGLRVFSLDDDLETEHSSKLFHQWRLLNRGAVALLTVALLLAVALSARPAQVDADSERGKQPRHRAVPGCLRLRVAV